MRTSVSFHPAAQQDADDAAGWYAERTVRAAVRFLDELDRVIELVADSPDRFQVFDADLRRAVFRRFPFFIVLRADELKVSPCRSPCEETSTILAQP